jgi:deoxyribodipyrimidine photo-lyase
MEKPALVWIRNDFRLNDNPALYEASLRDAPVVLVYIHERTPEITTPLGGASKVWLEKSLEVFEEKVKRFGYALVVREGDTLDILKSITRELQCSNIFWNRRYEQNAMH